MRRMSPQPWVCLYRDESLVVADKPAGLLSVPGIGPERSDCLAARVRADVGDALVVHRLDEPTSGAMVFGRGAFAQRALSMAFEQRRVAKRYEAIVHGLPGGDAGEIDLPLAADWPNRPRQCVDRVHGKPSLTRWRVLARDAAGGTARLALEPVTGRSHQLRVHLAAIGHPIVGDALYATDARTARSSAARLMLHSASLALPHPGDGRTLTVDSDVPF
jgi:tRNA pseudouridine32 synthase/23S rRNA pseudouridine746 synthase